MVFVFEVQIASHNNNDVRTHALIAGLCCISFDRLKNCQVSDLSE